MNQDQLWPPVTETGRSAGLFVVCDGMGGTDRGEVASQLLAEAVGHYAASGGYPPLDGAHLRVALDGAYAAYERFLDQHPLVSRMGSTLALVQFHQQGATIAHLGDSRVYWLRDGQILLQTKDHKRVDELVEAGVLTPKQAQHHPWRNLLSRAVAMQRDEAGAAIRTPAPEAQPDVVTITDLRAGDYFFLCTDGVLEHLTPCALTTILNSTLSDQDKLQTLLSICEGRTSDNYSGFLVRVATVERRATAHAPEPILY